MTKGHFSGTVAHSNMAHHGGKVAGAGELNSQMGGPGKQAMKTKSKMSGLPFDGVGKKTKPKGMKVTQQGC